MKTEKLFLKNTYLKEYTATLVEATYSEEGFVLILEQTIFFPTGGGQSCDKGKINNFEVLDVYERDGLIYHIVQCNNRNIVWTKGQQVFCELNWEHRFLNMQRHCGEHILSGIFYREYGGVNRGFHMGNEYMTIDISLEERDEFTSLTWEMCVEAEFLANKVIWSDAPVTVRHFTMREDAVNLPLRKKLNFDEDISIVCVGDISNPADCVACCGTHPSTAGQIGLIKILKVENNKGMFRVYCEAGELAYKLFTEYHEVISKLNKKYSATTNDLIDKISVQNEKSNLVKNELNILKQSVINSRVASIEEELKLIPAARILVKEYADMKVDDLLNIGRPLIPQLKTLLLIVSRQDNTLLLFSDGKIDCGKLVKENASIYQGKGGGNNTNARALFPKFEYIETFIDLLDKHLR